MRLDVRLGLYRFTQQPDDEIGGAQVTGTFSRNDVTGHFQELPVDPSFYQQGIETARIFNGWVLPADLDLNPRDELEVEWPPEHLYYGRRFQVVNATPPPTHPLRRQGFLTIKVRLREWSREN